jgi:hypothetical protein
MDATGANLSNYIKSLEIALHNAKEGANKVDIEKVYKDLDNCRKQMQFLLSDESFPYESTSEIKKECPHIMEVNKIDEGIFKFTLDRLLPHRLDYHKLTYKTAAKINQMYAKSFQRDIFDFISGEDFCRYNDSDKCVLVFVNYYDPADNSTWDNDNLDVKVFIDFVVSGKFIADDSHDKLSYCMLSREGVYTHTEAYLAVEDNLGSILRLLT